MLDFDVGLCEKQKSPSDELDQSTRGTERKKTMNKLSEELAQSKLDLSIPFDPDYFLGAILALSVVYFGLVTLKRYEEKDTERKRVEQARRFDPLLNFGQLIPDEGFEEFD